MTQWPLEKVSTKIMNIWDILKSSRKSLTECIFYYVIRFWLLRIVSSWKNQEWHLYHKPWEKGRFLCLLWYGYGRWWLDCVPEATRWKRWFQKHLAVILKWLRLFEWRILAWERENSPTDISKTGILSISYCLFYSTYKYIWPTFL